MSFRRAYKLPDKKEIGLLLEGAARRLEAASYLFNLGFFADAVSRAYYSMYFAAKALLLKNIGHGAASLSLRPSRFRWEEV